MCKPCVSFSQQSKVGDFYESILTDTSRSANDSWVSLEFGVVVVETSPKYFGTLRSGIRRYSTENEHEVAKTVNDAETGYAFF